VQITIKIKAQQISRIVGRTSGISGKGFLESELLQLQGTDEGIHKPDRIFRGDVVVDRLRQEQFLLARRTGKMIHSCRTLAKSADSKIVKTFSHNLALPGLRNSSAEGGTANLARAWWWQSLRPLPAGVAELVRRCWRLVRRKSMKTRTKRTLVLLLGVLALTIGGAAWLGFSWFSLDSARNRASAIDSTLSWGRLAPFPVSARKLSSTAHGTMFSRAFRTSFVAPAADIEQWLRQSPGTREVIPTTPTPGIRHFQIAPGGGAQHAEITVDDTKHQVFIYVYRS
jgi:hypothetical protein